MYTYRLLDHTDASKVIQLLRMMCEEMFNFKNPINNEILSNDLKLKKLHITGLFKDNELIGFGAWHDSYDLHCGISGGYIMDLFILKEHRNKGLGIKLLSNISNYIKKRGGAYISGPALNEWNAKKFSDKYAIKFDGTMYTLAASAFNKFADLHNLKIKEIVRNLPGKDMNYK